MSEGINPQVGFVFTQSTPAGEVVRIDPSFLEVIKEMGIYVSEDDEGTKEFLYDIVNHKGSIQHRHEFDEETKAIFRTAFEINPYSHLDMVADRQEFICQGQSCNLFLANMTGTEISKLYTYAMIHPKIFTVYYQYGLRDASIKTNYICESCS